MACTVSGSEKFSPWSTSRWRRFPPVSSSRRFTSFPVLRYSHRAPITCLGVPVLMVLNNFVFRRFILTVFEWIQWSLKRLSLTRHRNRVFHSFLAPVDPIPRVVDEGRWFWVIYISLLVDTAEVDRRRYWSGFRNTQHCSVFSVLSLSRLSNTAR